MSLMNFYTFCISCNVSLCSHQVIKEDLERAYKNTNMKPMSHSTYLRLQVLREIFWDVDKKLELLMKLTFTDLVAFVPKILSQVLLCFILFSLQSFYTFLLCENWEKMVMLFEKRNGICRWKIFINVVFLIKGCVSKFTPS